MREPGAHQPNSTRIGPARGREHEGVKKKLGGEPRNIGIVFKSQENGLIEYMSVAVFLSTSAIV